jgi:hypothetical protein
MITKEEKKEAVDHYNRMISWAVNQNGNDPCDRLKMLKELGEMWGSEYCVLCDHYLDSNFNDPCEKCPLAINHFRCSSDTPSEWGKMQNSTTWSEWLEHAIKLRDIIASLPEEYDYKVTLHHCSDLEIAIKKEMKRLDTLYNEWEFVDTIETHRDKVLMWNGTFANDRFFVNLGKVQEVLLGIAYFRYGYNNYSFELCLYGVNTTWQDVLNRLKETRGWGE